jgi:hypothetical protein
VAEEVQRHLTCFIADAESHKAGEEQLKDLDADIGFYKGDGLFLADVLVERCSFGADEGNLSK